MGEAVLAGRYQLQRLVGRGGMGEVWQAFDERLHRTVAVKIVSLLAGGGSAAGELRARFLREARITASLQHPRIVAVHDLGEAPTGEGSAPFLVMEFLRGEGLEAVVARGPVGGPQAARWGAQICDALAEAHRGGILHRDIKPANVFVTTSGGVKVLDFGIARAADPAGTGDLLTRTGTVIGTVAYMAPEQARGRPEQRSDLYALGCLLFELVTGRLPFVAPDALGHLTAHLHDTPPAPSSVLPGIPAAWDALIAKLLEKDPARRYASATELAAALRALHRHGDQDTPAPSHRTPTVVDEAASPPRPSHDTTTASPPEPAAPQPMSRRAALRFGVGAAAVAAAGTAAVVYLTEAPGKDRVAWSRPIGDAQKLDRNSPTSLAGGGRWFIASGAGPVMVHAFDAADGTPSWKSTHNGQTWNTAGGASFALAGPAAVLATKQPSDRNPWIDALDAASGRPLWRQEADEQTWDVHLPSGLVILSGNGSVAGLDPHSGDDRWRHLNDDPSGALLAGDLVISAGTALQGTTGKTVWQQPHLTPVTPLAHVLGKTFLCYEAGEHSATDLVCRSVHTGAVVWRAAFNDSENSAASSGPTWQAAVSGTTVFLPRAAGNRHKPAAVDGATGAVKWTYDGPHRQAYDFGDDGSADPAPGVQGVLGVPGGFVLPTGKGTVCLDADSGRERWRSSDDDSLLAGPYVLTTKSHDRLFGQWHHLQVLDARTGRGKWAGDFTTGFGADPVAAGGIVCLPDLEGKLWALRV